MKHRLTRVLMVAEQAAVRDGVATTVVVVFRPGRKGRKTADSSCMWRKLPRVADLPEHLADVGAVMVEARDGS